MRVAFFGTPEFAVPTLTEVVGQGHEVVAVYTQPPRPAGRGMAARLSPVHQVATHFDLHVLTPEKLRRPGETARFADRGAICRASRGWAYSLGADVA